MENLPSISKATLKRYSDRLAVHGSSVKTLGWGSRDQQEYRFAIVNSHIPLHGASILDIGCGFGDLIDYCNAHNLTTTSYTGWDINPDLLEVAREKHPLQKFDLVDLSTTKTCSPVAEVGIMLGLLNYNLGSPSRNLEYSQTLVSRAFKCVSSCLVVDFLSEYRFVGYEKEDSVYYHNPTTMLEFALSLSPNVYLIHNYQPIPQKEFMLAIYK